MGNMKNWKNVKRGHVYFVCLLNWEHHGNFSKNPFYKDSAPFFRDGKSFRGVPEGVYVDGS